MTTPLRCDDSLREEVHQCDDSSEGGGSSNMMTRLMEEAHLYLSTMHPVIAQAKGTDSRPYG